MSCNCCGAEKLFDLKTAKKELKKYKKSGPGKPTRKLLALLGDDQNGKTLLDIGGGIGAIQWHFLESGGSRTMDVDYSEGYIEVARTFGREKGWGDQIQFIQRDFLEVSDEIDKHDLVTLDKVICCYPDYKGLLDRALPLANETIAVVYPMGGPIAKIINLIGRAYLALTKNPFRPYIHPVGEIRNYIEKSGFRNVQRKISFPWHVEVYHRN